MMNRKKTQRLYTPQFNVCDYVANLEKHGDNVAYAWFGHDAERTLHELTYRELAGNVKKLAAGLCAEGMGGARIALCGETSPEWVTTYLAILLSGGVAIPMDRELAVTEIEAFLAFAEADGIFFSSLFNEKFDHLAREHPSVRHVIALEPAGCTFADVPGFISFDALLTAGAADTAYAPTPSPDTGRMAAMLFTSGTTGSSKCVMLSEKNIFAAMNAACECVEFFPDDTILSVLPIHHTYELCCMLAGLNYGMKIAINDSLKHVMKNINFFKPTGIVLVPLFISTMYKRILDEARRKKQDKVLLHALTLSRTVRRLGLDPREKMFAGVRSALGGRIVKFVSGGAPLNPRLVRDFEELGIHIAEGYGITECSPLLACNPYYAPKPGSVGPAVNCCRVRIMDGTLRLGDTIHLMAGDRDYEVVRLGEDGLPRKVKVTDHAGSFVNYEQPFEEYVAQYAQPMLRRKTFVADFAGFAAAYVEGFRRRLTEVQASYRARKAAFDELFSDRPYDTNGSGAYRWACALRRLDACDPENVTRKLAQAIGI